MALRSRQKAIEVASPTVVEAPRSTAHQAPMSLVAASARILEGQSWRTYKFGDDSWQQEAWRLYDIIGELRFVANWIGSACSRIRLYVAEVDDNGRIQKETEKKKVAGLADTLFGSPAAKAEALRLLGINLTIAGDAYIIGRSTDDPESDEWYVLSCSELKRYRGGAIYELDPEGARLKNLDPSRDMIIRVWTPHPRRTMWADSPTRAAMPMLFEIEKLTRYVFAQMDSRLFSAGLLPIPKEVSFPDDDPETTGAESLANRLMKTGSASLRGEGTAAGIMPTVVEMPTDALGKIELIQFSPELSKQALELRQEALRRFAVAMDIDPGIMTGVGDANHWGAWQVVEGMIKVHIEPILTRICDGLNQSYLRPALKAIGDKPDRYVFWYDIAPLTVRPERLKDTQGLFKDGIVSREAVRLSGDYAKSDAPSQDEDLERFTRELMLRDPNLMNVPAIRALAGYTEDVLPANIVIPAATGPGGAGPPPPPPPPTGIQPGPAGTTPPAITEAQNAPGGPPPVPSGQPAMGLAASASVPPYVITGVVANAAVLRAMEIAGKRLAGNANRTQFSVEPHELHTRIRVSTPEKATKLLDGAWNYLTVLTETLDVTVDTALLRESLQGYCVDLLVTETPHSLDLLAAALRKRGLLDGLT